MLIIFKKKNKLTTFTSNCISKVAPCVHVKLFMAVCTFNAMKLTFLQSPKITFPQIKEREISLTNTMIADYKGGLCVG
jgi:hypothetical protein